MSGRGESLPKKNGSGFICLAICGGKERLYHSSSRKIVKVGWESNFGELLRKVDQDLALSLFLLSSYLCSNVS